MTNPKPYEGHTPLPWVADLGETYSIRAADGRVAYCQHVHLTGRRDPSTVAANAALIVERVNKGPAADAMASAIEALLNEETHDLHVGYDSGPGGGNFVYADVIRTDSEAFVALRQALAAYREQSNEN